MALTRFDLGVRTASGMLSARLSLARLNSDQGSILKRTVRKAEDLVAFAAAESPFYRDLYRDVRTRSPVPFHELPVLSKATMMDNLDRIFTNPELNRQGFDPHVASSQAGEWLLGRYRIISTSGSTGRRGLVTYNRREWNVLVAAFWRWMAMVGLSPHRGRQRVAILGAPGPSHLMYRLSASIDIGIFHVLYLSAGLPMPDLLAKLSRFQPEFIVSYPSLCAMLAAEQLDGRLDINPRTVVTGGEIRTPDMAERIEQAWRTRSVDSYAMAEAGLIAGECREQGAMHIFNDNILLEVVDDSYRPVAPGVLGSRVLITNLFLRTQPIIRYEVSDMMTISDVQCGCHRSWPLIRSLDGRSNDLLWFRDLAGQEISVHPMQLQSVIMSAAGVRAYQILQETETIRVLVVIDNHARANVITPGELQKRFTRKLDLFNVRTPCVRVEAVDAIAREPGSAGKVKLVISDRSPALLHPTEG